MSLIKPFFQIVDRKKVQFDFDYEDNDSSGTHVQDFVDIQNCATVREFDKVILPKENKK